MSRQWCRAGNTCWWPLPPRRCSRSCRHRGRCRRSTPRCFAASAAGSSRPSCKILVKSPATWEPGIAMGRKRSPDAEIKDSGHERPSPPRLWKSHWRRCRALAGGDRALSGSSPSWRSHSKTMRPSCRVPYRRSLQLPAPPRSGAQVDIVELGNRESTRAQMLHVQRHRRGVRVARR